MAISIHALLAESDGGGLSNCFVKIIFLSTLSLRRATETAKTSNAVIIFLSTLSLRRATNARLGTRQRGAISIHALLAESDEKNQYQRERKEDFYPRSPCGERQAVMNNIVFVPRFLSTLSLRRATAKVHKTMGHFCTYETNFMGIASSC